MSFMHEFQNKQYPMSRPPVLMGPPVLALDQAPGLPAKYLQLRVADAAWLFLAKKTSLLGDKVTRKRTIKSAWT